MFFIFLYKGAKKSRRVVDSIFEDGRDVGFFIVCIFHEETERTMAAFWRSKQQRMLADAKDARTGRGLDFRERSTRYLSETNLKWVEEQGQG